MSAPSPVAIGIDLGTSGCRAVALDLAGRPVAGARVALPAPVAVQDGWAEQDAELWWSAVLTVLGDLAADLPPGTPASLAVDGTSATLLLAGPDGRPLGPALMYNDRRAADAAARIATVAPPDSPARGAGSSLAKALHLWERLAPPPGTRALHQADWVGGRLAARPGWSDWNNALKLGFDAASLTWPEWVAGLCRRGPVLPDVVAPGTPVGPLDGRLAERLGLAASSCVVAGTTDSTAAVLAAGALEPGDAVTCLGSTLVLKIVAERPLASPDHGVYSHRLPGRHPAGHPEPARGLWVAGGASNCGGALLKAHFTDAELAELSAGIDPERPSGLDYYPLPRPGERFPRNDPSLQPRLAPIPADRQRFLHGLLEGIAAVEAEGYRLLGSLGAPAPRRVLTTGGGAANAAWTRLRTRMLGIPVLAAAQGEAAHGAALLALAGLRSA